MNDEDREYLAKQIRAFEQIERKVRRALRDEWIAIGGSLPDFYTWWNAQAETHGRADWFMGDE